MKLIIAGTRTVSVSLYFVRDCLDNLGITHHNPDILSEVISGTANGVDKAGEKFANYYHIPLIKFPADWEKYGKGAGPIRNKQMAEYADALLLIWDGESKGSANMKATMKKLNKPVYEIIIRSKHVQF